jgi:hypothetical protein
MQASSFFSPFASLSLIAAQRFGSLAAGIWSTEH